MGPNSLCQPLMAVINRVATVARVLASNPLHLGEYYQVSKLDKYHGQSPDLYGKARKG